MAKIPAQLGSPVTFRRLSWRDMVIRAWGEEFFAPDRAVYPFSEVGGTDKDSTDKDQTGFYRRK